MKRSVKKESKQQNENKPHDDGGSNCYDTRFYTWWAGYKKWLELMWRSSGWAHSSVQSQSPASIINTMCSRHAEGQAWEWGGETSVQALGAGVRVLVYRGGRDQGDISNRSSSSSSNLLWAAVIAALVIVVSAAEEGIKYIYSVVSTHLNYSQCLYYFVLQYLLSFIWNVKNYVMYSYKLDYPGDIF